MDLPWSDAVLEFQHGLTYVEVDQIEVSRLTGKLGALLELTQDG